MVILAIDQGTTSTRALRVETQGPDAGCGNIVNALEHRQIYPAPGWVEHNPLELLANVRACIRAAIDLGEPITALGVDNQGESCLAWDRKTKEPISPVIVWQDNRTLETIARLKDQGKESLVTARAGLPLDPYFSAAKLAWILENIPRAGELHRQGRLCLGTTDAFFLDHLTGRCVTDISTASRTSLMNLTTGQWDPVLCDLFQVPMETLPEIVPTTHDFGSLNLDGREIPVTASVVDQQAALFGHGCARPGDAKITFGTGAFALAVTPGLDPALLDPATSRGLLPTVAWQRGNGPIEYALDGGVSSAASAVNWARSLGLFKEFDQINTFDGPSAVAQDLVFVPALNGLGCPHWDRSAAGTWLGLSLDTTPLAMVRSLLEGIAFRTAEVVKAMTAFTPVGERISIDGGLSANSYFCHFLADVLQKEIQVKTTGELTAFGTARLAGAPLPARDADLRCISPTRDLSGFAEKYAQAVERSRNWKG